jgi:hypothetical protein
MYDRVLVRAHFLAAEGTDQIGLIHGGMTIVQTADFW